MPQFRVYRNPNPASKTRFPLLLDVQSDLVTDLETRVVVPLCLAASMRDKLIRTLMPALEIEGKSYAMLTPQLAGISKKQLGTEVADLGEHRDEILAALDLLITGI
ncbi:CcdB family protein [Fontimonas sp. SYSU GA230001]|uniref:CcdB family protein n=1 Tax=Fontimonas sp. SYSU GA230001 TaxID=3142450 RepID=UPI0032B3B623